MLRENKYTIKKRHNYNAFNYFKYRQTRCWHSADIL